MLDVTERAAEQLSEMLTEAKAPDDAAIRFAVNGDSLEPRLDHPREDDKAYRFGEKIILLVQPPMAEALSNRVLDIEDSPAGKQLTIRNKDSESSDDQE